MTLKLSQTLPLSVEFQDKFGNIVSSSVVPTWVVTDPTSAALEVAADGMSATLKPLGKAGDVTVQVSIVDNGKTVMGELVVTLLAGDIAMVVIKPGTPVDA